MNDRAIFLDRDGTLIHPEHYPSRPEQIVLYDGLAAELRTAQAAGLRLVVITNQAGIARGYFSLADLEAMHAYLHRQLLLHGVRLDGIYYCPHHPDGSAAEFAKECLCRKPNPGMLRQAASELGIDLFASWMVGDILDDVQAGNSAGCRTVLVDLGTESRPATASRAPSYTARNTLEALRLIGAVEGFGPPADLRYQPERWRELTLAGEGRR
jgi:D-glycero-D-manno-heptose 1,7-bisphosphate phosphatase